ncbi:MAG TPA: GNAT family N-acetyltransferase [Steroidobacteraceae bacterium]|nr:GNAT family N-acetyltransferase [Steroidobacteraceae bacterium]
MQIDVTSGAAASRLLADGSFERAWGSLAGQCPWATIYQSIAFARTWFACYPRYAPVIVSVAAASGGLDALMVLAADPQGRIVGAPGLQQCEYQAWLQSAQAPDDFVASALAELARRFRLRTLVFKYLPGAMNIDALQRSRNLRSRMAVRQQQRALWNFAERSADESLRKKSNKSKLSRLGRGGAVELVQIHSAEQFKASLREMAPLYDFRQLALHGSAPFVEDDRKYDFHERLFELSPPMLHASELRVGSTAVSMVLGFVTGTQIHLAIVAHRADFAEHSVNKMHLLLLARALAGQGMQCMDLTPGDDEWKTRHATQIDHVVELTLFAQRRAWYVWKLRSETRNMLKRLAGSVGVTRETVRAALQLRSSLLRLTPAKIVRRLRPQAAEYRVYRLALTSEPGASSTARRNVASDLLQYPAQFDEKQAFLSTALARIEAGHNVYTVAEGGRLLHCGWMSLDEKASFFTEVQQSFEYPEVGAVLYDFWSLPAARGRGLYQSTLRRMLADAMRVPNIRYAYISCLASNAASRHVIEKMGFIHFASIHRTAGRRPSNTVVLAPET